MPEINNPGSSGLGAGDVNLLSQGRLTLVSLDPAPAADQIGKSTVYFTPYKGNTIAVLNGSGAWELIAFTEISIVLSGLTSGKNYDLFVYDNAGTLTLDLSAPWTNDTTRADALALVNGVRVKAADHTRRFLGTLRATGATTTEDSSVNRYLINYYNRVTARLFSCPNYSAADADTSYDFISDTYARINAGTDDTVNFLSNGEDSFLAHVRIGGYYSTSTLTPAIRIGVGIDGDTNIPMSSSAQANGAVADRRDTEISEELQPLAEGKHSLRFVACTFSGNTFHIIASGLHLGASTAPAISFISGSIER
jgi:hypothetical protein